MTILMKILKGIGGNNMNKDLVMQLIYEVLEENETFSDLKLTNDNVLYISNYNEENDEIETFELNIKEV